MAGEEVRWRAGPARDIVWSELEGDYVVYYRPSGRTHLLNAATADLLESVLVQPRTASEAAEALAARQDAPSSPEFAAAVAESIWHLEHLGLIERCER